MSVVSCLKGRAVGDLPRKDGVYPGGSILIAGVINSDRTRGYYLLKKVRHGGRASLGNCSMF